MPSRKATQSSSLDTVGSSPNTSSPTDAPAMASRSRLQGFVTVSLRRSTTGAEEAQEVAAAPEGLAAAAVVGGPWVVTVTAVRACWRICAWTVTRLALVLVLAVFLARLVVLPPLRFLLRSALARPARRPGIMLCPCGASGPRAADAAAAVRANMPEIRQCLSDSPTLCWVSRESLAGVDPRTSIF